MSALRTDLQCIADWIVPGSRVLDLGCGDGQLLASLARNKNVTGFGVEIDVDQVVNCIGNGLNVIQTDLESGLSAFESESFDYVVLSLTIQAMHNIEGILAEMLRVGRTGIVTFPNFGFWENRWQILRGHMPVSETIPYEWYNTPNIHFCTFEDFEALCREREARVINRLAVDQQHRHGWASKIWPNLLGEIGIYRVSSPGL